MKIGDDRLDNVDLGRSSGTDGMSGEREFELQPDHGLGSGRFGFDLTAFGWLETT